MIVMFEDKIDIMINQKVHLLYQKLKKMKIKGVRECIPSYASLLILYDPMVTSYAKIKSHIRRIGENENSILEAERTRVIEIPVCYGGEFGEDIENVAAYSGLSKEEVIETHSGVDYHVYMVGFLPGFPYLGGLDPRIHTPRLSNPRLEIPAGSVGIGGEQTGVYPLASPGGWQLIGRTPIRLYDDRHENPVMLHAGDTVRFVRICEEEFKEIAIKIEEGSPMLSAERGGFS